MNVTPRSKKLRTRPEATRELEKVLFGADLDSFEPEKPVAASSLPSFPSLESFSEYASGLHTKLKICIATEDVVGPVRNGGIGTTYSSVAEVLAKDGHDVTLLYLRGNFVETGKIQDSVQSYQDKGVRFVAVPDYVRSDGITIDEEWFPTSYNLLRYLLGHSFDLVHLSEWRGAGYLSLLAKHQKLAFARTCFVVKASSPWLWNRTYASQPLITVDELKKIHAERRSIELADVVISGSKHLLGWMAKNGYCLPEGRTFAQPNLMIFRQQPPDGRRPGDRIEIDEIVFFGRWETRKGLLIFCHAIERLLKQGVPLKKVTFLGKPGAPLDTAISSNLRYLSSITRRWPVEVSFLTQLSQPKALAYLSSGPRLAVMPSLIENSSLAIYETLHLRIPFIASQAGGNAELIREGDHDKVLFHPHPIALADMIASSIRDGAYIPHPSFDNQKNTATWLGFHQAVLPWSGKAAEKRAKPARPGRTVPRIAALIYSAADTEALQLTISSLMQQDRVFDEIIVASDRSEPLASLAPNLVSQNIRILDTADCDAGLSLNLAAAQSSCSHFLFLWEGTTLVPAAARTFEKVATATDAVVVNSLFEQRSRHVFGDRRVTRAPAPPGASGLLSNFPVCSPPVFVAREQFFELGGFTTDYRVLGFVEELISNAYQRDFRCETVPFELASVPTIPRSWLRAKGYNDLARLFRPSRPYYAAAPLLLRELMLIGIGLNARLSRIGLANLIGEKLVSVFHRVRSRRSKSASDRFLIVNDYLKDAKEDHQTEPAHGGSMTMSGRL